MQTMHSETNALIYNWDGETVRIEPWGTNSFRVRAIVMNQIKDTTYALLPQEDCLAAIQVSEYESSITNGKIKAVMNVNEETLDCRISFYDQHGNLLLREAGEGGKLKKKSRRFKPILGGDFSLTVTFSSNPDEKLYGMGQYQQDILNIKYCNLELAQRNSQASVPFALSSLGYGFFWHNPAIGHVSFGKNTTEWFAESTLQMDYWITAGDTPAEIEQSYANVTGKVPMMPEYGMGFWQCKLRYWSQDQLLHIAREYHHRGIPVDVIVCDFFHWPKMGDFRFDNYFWPDPEAMVRELKSMGMELMVSVWPQVDFLSENYQEMKQKGLLIRTERGMETTIRFGGYGTLFDATNPEARKYVWNKIKQNYYDMGIKIFWLDEAEPEFSIYDFDNYRYFAGPNLQIGNIYPQDYARAFYEGQTEAGQENIVNLIRCAWAGSQRFGALVWSGDINSDWETLRKQLCAGLNIGLAGIPWWTTDIGGFWNGNPASEAFRKLLVRWFEWGTFCPVMRLHGDRLPRVHLYKGDGTPALYTGGDNEIWSFGEDNYHILEKYIRFREKMRPYIRKLMEEAHLYGHPIMRTMFYEFPQDKLCWDLQEQYMFGSDILVAPVMYEDSYEKEVYLPVGSSWTCVHDGRIYKGGQTIIVQAKLDVIPVFLRDNRMPELIGQI